MLVFSLPCWCDGAGVHLGGGVPWIHGCRVSCSFLGHTSGHPWSFPASQELVRSLYSELWSRLQNHWLDTHMCFWERVVPGFPRILDGVSATKGHELQRWSVLVALLSLFFSVAGIPCHHLPFRHTSPLEGPLSIPPASLSLPQISEPEVTFLYTRDSLTSLGFRYSCTYCVSHASQYSLVCSPWLWSSFMRSGNPWVPMVICIVLGCGGRYKPQCLILHVFIFGRAGSLSVHGLLSSWGLVSGCGFPSAVASLIAERGL